MDYKRLLPVGVGFLAFLWLPEWISDTWLVGTRFLQYVHAFAPAAFVVGVGGAALLRLRLVTTAIVAVSLVVLNVRLFAFNRELAGLNQIIEAVPRGGDVHGLVVETGGTSEVFGVSMLGQTPAWATASRARAPTS